MKINKIVDSQNKRMALLVNKIIKKLNPKIWAILRERIINISPTWDDSFSFKVNGEARPANPEKTLFNIYLNLFSLRIFSYEATIGVIVHELAHVWEEYKNTSRIKEWFIVQRKKLTNRLRKKRDLHVERGNKIMCSLLDKLINNKFINPEEYTNSIAISWGFRKEIQQMKNEMILPVQIILPEGGFIPKEVKDKHTKLSLICPSCSKKYAGKYYHSEIESIGCSISLHNQIVPVAILVAKMSMSDEDMIEKGFFCPKCKQSKLIIKKREVINNYLQNFL